MTMAKSWVVLVFGLSGLLVSSLVQAASESANKTVTCKVTGMTCGGCAAMIEGSLLKTKGVKTAKVSFKNSEAVAEIDPAHASEGDVIAAIEKAGYKASVVEDPEAATPSQGAHAAASVIARPLSPAMLAVFREVLAVGYRPLPKEE